MTPENENKNTLDIGCSLKRWNPLEGKRQPTNVPSAYLSTIFVITWSILSIVVLAIVPSKEASISGTISIIFSNIHFSDVVLFSFGVFMTGIAMIGYLYTLKTAFTKILAYVSIVQSVITIFLACLLTMIVIFFFAVNLTSIPNVSLVGIFFLLIAFLCSILITYIYYKVVVLYSVKKVKLEIIVKIINESSRAIFDNFSLIPFSIALEFLCVIVFVYTLFLQKADIFISENNTNGTDHNLLLLLDPLTSFGGVFVILFILYFGHMVISMSIVDWYWNANSENFTKIPISQYVSIILRNHFGTLGFASTVLFPFVHAIYVAFHWTPVPTESFDIPFKRMSKLYLIFTIPDLSLTLSSIHGHSFQEASRKAFDLIMHNNLRYLAVMDISFNILMIIFQLLAFIFILITFTIFPIEIAVAIAVCIVVFSMALILMMHSTIKTIFLCILEDINENDGSDEKPFRMSPSMHKAFINLHMV